LEIQGNAHNFLFRWPNLEILRKDVNKKLEEHRSNGEIGSSLQAEVKVFVGSATYAMLCDLQEELKFVLITSKATLVEDKTLNNAAETGRLKNLADLPELSSSQRQAVTMSDGEDIRVEVSASTNPKCERCWHYVEDVGSNAEHPTICGRCISNLQGAGENRQFA
jgi:isoleucyl-tRNA synthetase